MWLLSIYEISYLVGVVRAVEGSVTKAFMRMINILAIKGEVRRIGNFIHGLLDYLYDVILCANAVLKY